MKRRMSDIDSIKVKDAREHDRAFNAGRAGMSELDKIMVQDAREHQRALHARRRVRG